MRADYPEDGYLDEYEVYEISVDAELRRVSSLMGGILTPEERAELNRYRRHLALVSEFIEERGATRCRRAYPIECAVWTARSAAMGDLPTPSE